jgi:hypothetical protein
MAVMGNIGSIIGTYLFSFYLHDATMEGMDATRGFVAASGFMGIVALGATWTVRRPISQLSLFVLNPQIN